MLLGELWKIFLNTTSCFEIWQPKIKIHETFFLLKYLLEARYIQIRLTVYACPGAHTTDVRQDKQPVHRWVVLNSHRLVFVHKLGTDTWDKAKRKAAEKVRDVAAELLDIYAQRQAKLGNIFRIDKGAYAQFSDSFPFEETDDQANAISHFVLGGEGPV